MNEVLGVRVDDITGKKYGRLTVVSYAGLTKDKKAQWNCVCECGNEKTVRAAGLKSGDVRSCGCLAKEAWREVRGKQVGEDSSRYKHGLSKSRINSIYREIKGRCNCTSNPAYPRYGGRGIKMCEEWEMDFMAFYQWSMDHGYSDNLTIDRIDNDKGYSPDNCRWSTWNEQENNRSNNARIEYLGETHTISEWGDILGIRKGLLYKRHRKGMPPEKMFYKGRLR